MLKAQDDAASRAKTINNLESQIGQQRMQCSTHEKIIEEARSSLGKRLRAEMSEHVNRMKAEETSIARLDREKAKYEDVIRTLETRVKAKQSEHEGCRKDGCIAKEKIMRKLKTFTY